MALTPRSRPTKRVGSIFGAVLAVLAMAACGGDDADGPEPATPPPKATYGVLQATCPDGFSESETTTAVRSPIEFAVMADREGGSSWEGAGDVAALCVSDSDGDPFPFVASQIEFDVAPGGAVTGSATWSDSVGLSMNALISGSIVDLLGDFALTLTAPNGDTLSEIVISGSSS